MGLVNWISASSAFVAQMVVDIIQRLIVYVIAFTIHLVLDIIKIYTAAFVIIFFMSTHYSVVTRDTYVDGLNEGDVLLYTNHDLFMEIRKNDLVLCKGYPHVRRVIEVYDTSPSYKVRDDYFIAGGMIVNRKQLLGKVMMVVPYVGNGQRLLNEKMTMVLQHFNGQLAKILQS